MEKSKDNICNVAFIVLFGANWNSYKTVYESLLSFDKVNVQVYVMPRLVKNQIVDLTEYRKNCDFFKENTPGAIPLYDVAEDKWSPLKTTYDYIFYDKPYMGEYKDSYRANVLCRSSKICYVPYFFPAALTDTLLNVTYNISFFRYCYLFFSPSSFITQRTKVIFKNSIKKAHRVFELGFPRFDCKVPSKDHLRFTLLWIPRFTTPGMRYDDPSETTSFFDFKDYVLNSGETFIIRPHPLAFSKYIEYKVMTADEVDAYKKSVEDSPTCSLDPNPNYLDSFGYSDVLLADYSSLISEYICQDKPVIYCGNIEAISDPVLRDALYVENEWSKILVLIEQLKQGIDPLRENRQKYIESLQASDGKAGLRIAKTIVADYFGEHT
jgi:hypothetical protein